jgi:hypothetical protein
MMMGRKMGKDTDALGIEDSSGLTDADWSEINRLKRIYDDRGRKALFKALADLMESDPVRSIRIIGAFFPSETRETVKDVLAAKDIEEEDLKQTVRNHTH